MPLRYQRIRSIACNLNCRREWSYCQGCPEPLCFTAFRLVVWSLADLDEQVKAATEIVHLDFKKVLIGRNRSQSEEFDISILALESVVIIADTSSTTKVGKADTSNTIFTVDGNMPVWHFAIPLKGNVCVWIHEC